MNMIKNQKNFKEKVLSQPGIQVIKFYADWSGPCQVMAPIFSELSSYYSSSITFFTIDVEVAPSLKEELGVKELPTILFYQNGEVIDFVNGMISKNALIAKLENTINQNN